MNTERIVQDEELTIERWLPRFTDGDLSWHILTIVFRPGNATVYIDGEAIWPKESE